jgi:biotin transporter BioY
MEKAEAPKRWPALEKPAVSIPLKLLAVLLAAVWVANRFGAVTLPGWVPRVLVIGVLASLLLGWRWFRDMWTLVMSSIALGIAYVLGVGIVSLFSRIGRADMLDLRKPKQSLWKTREPLTPDQLAQAITRQF